MPLQRLRTAARKRHGAWSLGSVVLAGYPRGQLGMRTLGPAWWQLSCLREQTQTGRLGAPGRYRSIFGTLCSRSR